MTRPQVFAAFLLAAACSPPDFDEGTPCVDRQTPDLAACATSPNDVEVADLNGDGTPDLVTAYLITNDLSVQLSDASGVPGERRVFPAGGQEFNSNRLLAVGDIDGDGDVDIALNNASDAFDIKLLFNDGRGRFAQREIFFGSFSRGIAIADADGDGHLDIAAGIVLGEDEGDPGALGVFFGAGDGTFAPLELFAANGFPRDLIAGDLDGDGRVDLALLNTRSDTISFFRGGAGRARVGEIIGSGAQGLDIIALGDLDGDGALDIAFTDEIGHVAGAFLNNGAGAFGDPVTVSSLEVSQVVVADLVDVDGPLAIVQRLRAADLDGDGGDDLIAAEAISSETFVFAGADL
jgi:hypothetical protein